MSGRVYFSFGEALPDPGRTGGGSPIRYPGVHPGDDGRNIRWDFIELTDTNSGGDVADDTARTDSRSMITRRRGGRALVTTSAFRGGNATGLGITRAPSRPSWRARPVLPPTPPA